MSLQPKIVSVPYSNIAKLLLMLHELSNPYKFSILPVASKQHPRQSNINLCKGQLSSGNRIVHGFFPEVQRCRDLCRSFLTNTCMPVALADLHLESKYHLFYAVCHDSSRTRVSSMKKVNENWRTSRMLTEGRFVWFQQWPQQWQVLWDRQTFGRILSVIWV